MGLVALAMSASSCKAVRDYGKAERERRVAELAAADSAVAPSGDAGADVNYVLSTRSIATFHKKRLDECVDFTLATPEGFDAAQLQKKLDANVASATAKGAVAIPQSCEKQFEDRTVLASCEMTDSVEQDGAALVIVSNGFYYNVSTTKDSDGYMRDCLKRGGKWNAAKRDDMAASRERLRQRAADLQDLADKASAQ